MSASGGRGKPLCERALPKGKTEVAVRFWRAPLQRARPVEGVQDEQRGVPRTCGDGHCGTSAHPWSSPARMTAGRQVLCGRRRVLGRAEPNIQQPQSHLATRAYLTAKAPAGQLVGVLLSVFGDGAVPANQG